MIKLPTYTPKLQALKARLAEANYISLEEAEKRLINAHKTLWVQPDREAQWLRVKSNWPEMLREQCVDQEHANELLGQEAAVRFDPEPFDVSDYLIALEWIAPLNQRERALIVWKALGFRWGRMADAIRCSRLFTRTKCHESTAKTYYQSAISNAWAVAALKLESECASATEHSSSGHGRVNSISEKTKRSSGSVSSGA